MQICLQDTTKILGSIDSNFGEWPQDFLLKGFFQVNISLYLYPYDYVSWKGTYGELVIFLSEHKSPFIPIGLCLMKRHVWRVSYFFIKRLTKIEISSTFLNSHQKILQKFQNIEFSLRKFLNLNFHFMKLYSPNSNMIITTYPYIYLYIQ